MISIVGVSETAEHLAAKSLEKAIVVSWPWIATSERSNVVLIPNVQCYGQQTRDLDLVVLATIEDAELDTAFFRPGSRLVNQLGLPTGTAKVYVRSLCLVVEVKDHPQQNIRFDGGRVSVFYAKNQKWHDASTQSENQKYALKRYIEANRATAPWISNLIWLRNVDKSALPTVTSNLVASAVTWTGFLNVVAECARPRKEADRFVVDHESSSGTDDCIHAAEVILSKRQEPTRLDRKRVEAVCKGALSQALSDAVLHRLVLLSGRGGTGKTIMLLRLAYRYASAGTRCLLLTYNVALAADLERLLALTGIRDDIAEGTVRVKTVQSFMLSLLKAVGILGTDVPDDFLTEYRGYLDEALRYIRSGALTRDDLTKLLDISPQEFDWDLLLLDEAQDWPDGERDLLKKAYPPSRFVVADGREQLIRQYRNCDWRQNLRKDQYEVIQCTTSFRLKRNLARFANCVASELGLLQWSVTENEDLPGGRVIVVEGDYFSIPGLHSELVAECSVLGNKPIDMLACIPARCSAGQDPGSLALAGFQRVGQEIWNGTDGLQRRIPPTDVAQLRLVHYQSCRGLEGWTTINFGLDQFYEEQKAFAANGMHRRHGVPEDADAQASRYAAFWTMIPLTRAIDTLVVEVSERDSAIKTLLKNILSGGDGDYITWLST